jgi:hypothetical protein
MATEMIQRMMMDQRIRPKLISTSTESHLFLRSKALVWPLFCVWLRWGPRLVLKDSENDGESKIHQEVFRLLRETFEGPSEASPGGLGGFHPGRRIIRRPERSEPGGSGGFSPRKEESYDGPSEASQGGLGGLPPGKKNHTMTRAKRARGGLGGFPQERRIIL